MNTKLVSLMLVFVLVFSAISLASCSEAEPLPEGVSELPDLEASELAASLTDESGVIQWPAELLPEGFPVPEYDEIYSVSREDNELRIILLSKVKYGSNRKDILFNTKLAEAGYVFYMPLDLTDSTAMPAVNRDGWRVRTYNSKTEERLAPFAEKYGYAYEINVRQTVLEVPDSLFWKYPSPDTDLGYESKMLDEWPTELLPENIPVPNPDAIISMEVRPNGVFITLKEYLSNGKTYEQMLAEAGYYQMALQPHRDKDGNYYYVEYLGSSTSENEDGDYYVKTAFQICKYNEYIEK